MPSPSLVRAFLGLYLVLGLVVCLESVLTVAAALNGQLPPNDRPHALLLGSLEAVAAILFLIPRIMPVGAALLLTLFALAFGLHLVGGDPNYSLLIYAAAVLFIRVHGVRGYRRSALAA